VRRHDERLRGLAFRLLGGDRDLIDDALQEAYVRAYRALPGFRHDADLGSWLYRIVYNACTDEVRRVQREAAPFDTTAAGMAWDPASPAPGPECAVVARDATARALAGLPEIHRITVQAIPVVALLVTAAATTPPATRWLHAVGIGWLSACAAALMQALLGHAPLEASILTTVIVAGLAVWAAGASHALLTWRRTAHPPLASSTSP
jgi:RNA polymerase sigma factor (sigma-70 family)